VYAYSAIKLLKIGVRNRITEVSANLIGSSLIYLDYGQVKLDLKVQETKIGKPSGVVYSTLV